MKSQKYGLNVQDAFAGCISPAYHPCTRVMKKMMISGAHHALPRKRRDWFE